MLVHFCIELIKFEKTLFKNYLFRIEGSNTFARETACSTCLFIGGFEVETMPKLLIPEQKKEKLMKKIIRCPLMIDETLGPICLDAPTK